MSIRVNDFRWEPGKNDAEYIKLLESSRDEWQKIAQKAIAKLKALSKAQEPRVMTLEEVKQERICWIEDADDGMTVRLFPATMFGIGEYANGSKSYMFLAQKPWAVDANDCEWWYLIEDYGEIWRCWTSRPTNEQREATPWIS